ncbi:MAG: thiamine phosphate synthase [Pseudomonadota bacterium]
MRIHGFYGIVDIDLGPQPRPEPEPEPEPKLEPELELESSWLERARELTEALIAGQASVLQLRMKRASTRELLNTAVMVRDLTRAAGVGLVVNDRLDVALAANADGVHLGQEDLPLQAARQALRACGRSLLVGVSTHDLEQIADAVRNGADYLGFGPVFATTTKAGAIAPRGIEALREAVIAAGHVPVVAIGGITPARAPEIAVAGAVAAAAVAAVNHAPSIVTAAKTIARAFAGQGDRDRDRDRDRD